MLRECGKTNCGIIGSLDFKRILFIRAIFRDNFTASHFNKGWHESIQATPRSINPHIAVVLLRYDECVARYGLVDRHTFPQEKS